MLVHQEEEVTGEMGGQVLESRSHSAVVLKGEHWEGIFSLGV